MKARSKGSRASLRNLYKKEALLKGKRRAIRSLISYFDASAPQPTERALDVLERDEGFI